MMDGCEKGEMLTLFVGNNGGHGEALLCLLASKESKGLCFLLFHFSYTTQ